MTHQILSLGMCWKLFWATLKNTRKNPKFGRVRQIPVWELVGNSLIGICLTLPNLGFLWVFFKYPKISKIGNPLFFPVDFVEDKRALFNYYVRNIPKLHKCIADCKNTLSPDTCFVSLPTSKISDSPAEWRELVFAGSCQGLHKLCHYNWVKTALHLF